MRAQYEKEKQIQKEKDERSLLIKYKIERFLYVHTLKQCFQSLKEHMTQEILKEIEFLQQQRQAQLDKQLQEQKEKEENERIERERKMKEE